MARILIVDDETSMREFLEIFLKREGYNVVSAADGEVALKALQDSQFDLVLADLKMPRVGGLDILVQVKERSPETQVVVITAYSTTETALEAMKKGAYDYLSKPFNLDEIKVVIEKALEKRRLLIENAQLRNQVRHLYRFDEIIGRSPRIKEVFEHITSVTDTKTNVLLCGESGTGKELVARAIHSNSQRRDKPFVTINCSAIPDTLIESELFGHTKGAFTGALANKKGLFEVADQGTLFLDEVGDLSPQMQVKLLRAIQEKKIKPVGSVNETIVDVRIIAATNKDIKKEVDAGRFREDLYYRLNVFQILMPPLRERREDIPFLAKYFLDKYSRELNKPIHGFTPDALDLLVNYQYSGNVRELENIIERAVTIERGEDVSISSLPPMLSESPTSTPKAPQGMDLDAHGFNLEHYIEGVERDLVIQALQKAGGNKTEAAKLLGISFRSLRYKVEKYHIHAGDDEPGDG